MKKIYAAAVLLPVVLAFAGAGLAAAETSIGDTITYAFYSDSPTADITYFDADNDIVSTQDFRLGTYDRTEGWYYGTVTLTSRSTYQSAVANIQTEGKFAACAVRVNGQSSGMQTAHGRYAVASCG